MKKYLLVFIPFILIFCMSFAYAYPRGMNLYEQPQDDAKIIGTVSLSTGITPLNRGVDGWVKVSDPVTKKEGWVKMTDLQKEMMLPSFPQPTQNASQQPNKNTNGPVDLNKVLSVTPEQVESVGNQFQSGQPNFMTNLFDTMDKVYQKEMNKRGETSTFSPFGVIAHPEGNQPAKQPGNTSGQP